MNLLHQKGRMPILLDQNSQEYRLKSENTESLILGLKKEAIRKFKTENSVARTKLQELLTVRRADSNRSRSERRSVRMSNLKAACQTFNPNFNKEFMFRLIKMPNLSSTRIEYQLYPYIKHTIL